MSYFYLYFWERVWFIVCCFCVVINDVILWRLFPPTPLRQASCCKDTLCIRSNIAATPWPGMKRQFRAKLAWVANPPSLVYCNQLVSASHGLLIGLNWSNSCSVTPSLHSCPVAGLCSASLKRPFSLIRATCFHVTALPQSSLYVQAVLVLMLHWSRARSWRWSWMGGGA